MHRQKNIFLGIIFIINVSCFAQTKPIIGLKIAIDSALQNYPELQSKQMQIASAHASLSDASDQELPSLTFSDQLDIGTDNGLGGSYFPLGI
ncbi:MAG TPA: TolC family protein, partial [Bacteroidota bacterium]|nr:TolC family protein [Bacteroidota bacterium]